MFPIQMYPDGKADVTREHVQHDSSWAQLGAILKNTQRT